MAFARSEIIKFANILIFFSLSIFPGECTNPNDKN